MWERPQEPSNETSLTQIKPAKSQTRERQDKMRMEEKQGEESYDGGYGTRTIIKDRPRSCWIVLFVRALRIHGERDNDRALASSIHPSIPRMTLSIIRREEGSTAAEGVQDKRSGYPADN